MHPKTPSIFRRSARYDYTHAVLGGRSLIWNDLPMPRDRRVVILFRDDPCKKQAQGGDVKTGQINGELQP